MSSMSPKSFACLPVLALLVACGAEHPGPAATATTTPPVAAAPVVSPDHAAAGLVEQHLAAFNAHDREGAAALLHGDVLYFDATLGEAQRGRQAALDNIIDAYLDAMPDLEWVLRGEPIATGDGVAFEWTLTGTHTGAWMGIPASDQAIEIHGMSVVRVQDGAIVYKADYYDAATLNRQLGVK
jgi:steroid delta-isomerase-like uncharacterized protein